MNFNLDVMRMVLDPKKHPKSGKLSSCPAGHLRHRAFLFFVRCSVVLCPSLVIVCGVVCCWLSVAWPLRRTQVVHNMGAMKKMVPNNNKKHLQIHPNLTNNCSKNEVRGVPQALGGVLGAILAPRGVSGAPGTEKVTKSSFFPRAGMRFSV